MKLSINLSHNKATASGKYELCEHFILRIQDGRHFGICSTLFVFLGNLQKLELEVLACCGTYLYQISAFYGISNPMN